MIAFVYFISFAFVVVLIGLMTIGAIIGVIELFCRWRR